MPTPATLEQPITFESRLCKDICMNVETTDGNFCFQLPLFEDTGTNLLGFTEVDYGPEFSYTVSTNEAVDTSPSGTACGAPFTDNQQTLDASSLSLQLTNAGKYFFEVGLGDVSITNAINPDDDTPKEMLVAMRDGTLTREDKIAFTATDANTELFFKGTTDWVALDFPSLWIKAKSECDDTNEEIIYDLDVDSYRSYPAFYETTFTAANDTFYRITFKLAKTANVRVTITDSGGTDIIEDTDNAPIYDKIFLTGTLPSTTVTVRFEVDDFTEYPNPSFSLGVLTEVAITELCTWGVWIETTAEVFQSTLSTTHDTTAASVTGSLYNKNIQYCVDLSGLSAGDYQFRALNDCDLNEFYISNPIKVCAADCDYYSKITWDHGNIKFNGSYCLDYTNYTYIPFFRARVDLQDLTQEWESVTYKDAAGYLQQPYAFYRNIQIMQISGLPGFMRRAVSMALTDVFSIDGVEYKKLDDEDISPLFQATDPNAVRILVTKSGDFLESKNI